MSDQIDRLARRVTTDPFFLGSALAGYADSEHLDDAGLAAALCCTPDTLSLLRLCRRPRTDPAGFREDIERITERFGIDSTLLAEMVRRAEVLATFGQGELAATGTLIAARDRPELLPAADSDEEPER